MPAAAIPLAEIRKTRMLRRRVRGGLTREEVWGAETTDEVWDFEREDSAGTPWLVYHRPSVADGSYTLPVVFCGTLRACRAIVASGGADEELARRLAETAPVA